MGSLASLLGPLLGAAGGLGGALLGNNQQKWIQNALATVLGNENLASQQAYKGFTDTAGQLTGPSKQLINQSQNLIPSALQVPAELNNLEKTAPNWIMGKDGMTPQLWSYQDQLSNVGNQGMGLAGYGNSLLSGGGQTPLTNAYQNAAINALGSGGATPLTQFGAQGNANLLANTQGAAPMMTAQLDSAGNDLLANPNTQLSQFLQGQGMNLASGMPVLPDAIAASIAKNQTGQEYSRDAQQQQANALARGGGPGSIVASGAQNQGLADFSDQIQQAEGNSFLSALQGQQSLGLNQLGQGSQMAQAGGQLPLQAMGLGGSLVNNAGGMNTQQLLAALSNIPTLQGAQTNMLSTLGNFGLGGGQLALSGMNTGGNLMNSGLQDTTSAMNSAFQNSLAAKNLAGQQGLNATNALSNLYGQQLGAGSIGGQLFNYGTQPLNNILSGYSNQRNTALGAQSGIFGGYQPSSPMGNYLSNIGGFVNQGIQGLGGVNSGGSVGGFGGG